MRRLLNDSDRYLNSGVNVTGVDILYVYAELKYLYQELKILLIYSRVGEIITSQLRIYILASRLIEANIYLFEYIQRA